MIESIERMRKLVNDNLVMNLRFQMNGELNKLEQEIEQELNSRAERTCKPIIEPWDDPTKYDAYCGNCNYSLGDGELEPWNYCPYCGKAVKR